MFYRTNLPRWERGLRVVAGLAMVAAAVVTWGWTWPAAAGVAAGLAAAGTGWLGFCPACALFGRRAVERAR